MSRIAATFAQLQAQGSQGADSVCHRWFPVCRCHAGTDARHGGRRADVIELGVPFSDPSADGPVIQKAGDKALAFGIGLVPGAGHGARVSPAKTTTPVVLMGYANPVERYDQKTMATAAQQATDADRALPPHLCRMPRPPGWTAC
jgi:tryptophan synthase alpha chain